MKIVWYERIKILLIVNLVFIGYLLAVGWTGMGEYIYIVPFLYLFSSDFSTWQLYSTLVIPALVLLAWWRRGHAGWVFLQIMLLVESGKYLILSLVYSIVHTLTTAGAWQRNIPGYIIVILLLCLMFKLLDYVR